MRERAVIPLVLLLAIAVFHSAPRAVAQNPLLGLDSIEGIYYYKGLRLLEIRREGGQAVCSLRHQDADAEIGEFDGSQDTLMEKTARLLGEPRRAKFDGAKRIEFPGFPLTVSGVLGGLGFEEDDIPLDKRQELFAKFPTQGLGDYYERWTLQSDGSLKFECSTPLIIPGIACQSIAVGGFQQMLDQGWASDAETRGAFNETILALEKTAPQLLPLEMFSVEGNFIVLAHPLMDFVLSGTGMPNFLEAETRLKATEAKTAALSAVAIWMLALQDLAVSTLPADPFAPQRKIQALPVQNEILFYSVGPDLKDDGGAVMYDSTNGTKSAGDVVLRVR